MDCEESRCHLSAAHTRAIQQCEIALAEDPELAFGWSILGWCKLALSDTAGAVGASERALDLRPEDIDSHDLQIVAKWTSGEISRLTAEYRYKQLLKFDPENAAVHYRLGTIRIHDRSRIKEAGASMLEAARLSPENATIREV